MFTVTNLPSNMEIRFNGKSYVGVEGKNAIQINGIYDDNAEYSFEIYTKKMATCGDAYLITKKVKIPKYNVYSESDQCIEYEEFELCNKWYDGEIKDYLDFVEKFEQYKKEIQNQTEEYKDERTFFQKILDWCSDNIEITVSIIVVVIIAISIPIIIKINKIRKRVKVKL